MQKNASCDKEGSDNNSATVKKHRIGGHVLLRSEEPARY